MKKSHLLGTVCACVLAFTSFIAHAAAISGQGTWETTLQGRDLDGDAATFEAYYDTVLDITWLADANAAGTTMTMATAIGWAASLDINGTTGWRLPTVSPINGSTFDTTFTTDATSDLGFAPTTTDGTDGGWRDSSGNPVSEMGHMFYVTQGNLGRCPPDGGDGNPATCDGTVIATRNTGPFSNIQFDFYWTDTIVGPPNDVWTFNDGWYFNFAAGNRNEFSVVTSRYAWAVHDGNVGVVPVPAAVWLFGSGLLGLIGIARRKKA